MQAIVELARRLGQAINESPQAGYLRAARHTLNDDPELSKLLKDYQEQGVKIGEAVNVKLLDRLKAIEMIGKHTDVSAFTERVEIATDQQLMDQLLNARKRARKRNAPSDDSVPSFL